MKPTRIMSFLNKLDRWLGRGSYYPLQARLDPDRKYNQFIYAELLERLVAPETRWLDGGCGHQILEGRLGEQENRLVRRAKLVVGCDSFGISLTRHRTIRDRVMCTLNDLPFADESFTLVTLNMVVEHLTEPDRVFREIARVLDPGGLVVLMTPNRNGYYVQLSNVARAVIPKKFQSKLIRYLESREAEDVFETHYLANTRRQLQRIMQAAGLEPHLINLSRGRAFFYFFAPLSVAELAIIRCLGSLGFDEVVSDTLLAVYSKPARRQDATRTSVRALERNVEASGNRSGL